MTNLDPFIDQWAVLLTSYRRDGTPVPAVAHRLMRFGTAHYELRVRAAP